MYKGYADDPRNTDNAWIETMAINYHDETGTYLKNLKIKVSATRNMSEALFFNAEEVKVHNR